MRDEQKHKIAYNSAGLLECAYCGEAWALLSQTLLRPCEGRPPSGGEA